MLFKNRPSRLVGCCIENYAIKHKYAYGHLGICSIHFEVWSDMFLTVYHFICYLTKFYIFRKLEFYHVTLGSLS